MPRVKPLEPKTMTQRLTIRMQWEDWQKLRELQLVLRLPTPGHTVRSLIRMHYAVEQSAVRKMRRDPRAKAELARLLSTIDADFEGATK